MSLGCLSIRAGGARRPAAASGDQRQAYSEAVLHSRLPAMPSPRSNRTMDSEQRRIAACRRIAAGLVCGIALAASAQTTSNLPATPPTSLSNANSLTPPIAAAPTRADTLQRHRAHVTYANGMLEVRADNSSLNQILREVSRQTGMKIVGGVADQRVFGSYGPAPAATVLQTLLDGTGTNILLQESLAHAPEQLVLTPQTGGPTPPPPNSPSYDATEAEPELALTGVAQPAVRAETAAPAANVAPAASPNAVPSTPPSMPQPANNVFGNPSNVSPTASTVPVTDSVPLSTLPTPSVAPPVSGIVDSPNPPPAGSTTAGFTSQTPPDNNPNTAPPATATTDQSSPNGVKTPEQIYQELKQLQQKKTPNPQANPQGSSAPQ